MLTGKSVYLTADHGRILIVRIAAIYDIHANLPALDAVLAEIRRERVDRIVVGGDVLPGPLPTDTLARLLALEVPTDFIYGNGESAVLAELAGGTPMVPPSYRPVLQWVAKQLSPSEHDAITRWPAMVRHRVDGIGDVLFCHATPRNDTEIFSSATAEERLLPVFEGVDAALVVVGHTHMQFDRMVGRIRVVNAGSVGMPFGPSGADWLLLGPTVDLRHTTYDLQAAAEQIRRSDYPQAEEFAARDILNPRTAREAFEMYARAELK